MFKRAYRALLQKAEHQHAVWYLAGVSFIESFISPIPPDLLLIPMVVSDRSRAWFYASVCTAASVAGGVIGYGIGYWLFELLGEWIIRSYGLQGGFTGFQAFLAQWGFLGIVLKGATPIPYKFVTITCGVAGFNFSQFIVASFLSRGMRFFVEAALLWQFGPWIHRYVQKYTLLFLALLTLVLGLGFWGVKYISLSG